MKKKIIRRVLILVVFIFIYSYIKSLSITAESSFRNREKYDNYGPSEVVHIEEIENNKLFLSKYDKWISCMHVERKFGFWFSDNFKPVENDLSKGINYGTTGYQKNDTINNLIYYGIVNNEEIERVELIFENAVPDRHKETLVTELYDDMFFFRIEEERYDAMSGGVITPLSLKGLDNNGKIVEEIVLGKEYSYEPTKYTYLEPSGNFYVNCKYTLEYGYNEHIRENNYRGSFNLDIRVRDINEEYSNFNIQIYMPTKFEYPYLKNYRDAKYFTPVKLGKGTNTNWASYGFSIAFSENEASDIENYLKDEINILAKWNEKEIKLNIPKEYIEIEIIEASQ